MNGKIIKLLSLVLALVMVFALALTGCKKGAASDDDEDSNTSSQDAGGSVTINEDAQKLLDKYPTKLPDTKTLYFEGMEYVSLIQDQNDYGLYIIEYGYNSDGLVLKLVQTSVATREYLLEEGIIEENTEEAINSWFDSMMEMYKDKSYLAANISVDDKYVVLVQAIEKNDDGVEAYVFNTPISDLVADNLESGFILKTGTKSDYVKEEEDGSNEENPSHTGSHSYPTGVPFPDYSEMFENLGITDEMYEVYASVVNEGNRYLYEYAKSIEGQGIEKYTLFVSGKTLKEFTIEKIISKATLAQLLGKEVSEITEDEIKTIQESMAKSFEGYTVMNLVNGTKISVMAVVTEADNPDNPDYITFNDAISYLLSDGYNAKFGYAEPN